MGPYSFLCLFRPFRTLGEVAKVCVAEPTAFFVAQPSQKCGSSVLYHKCIFQISSKLKTLDSQAYQIMIKTTLVRQICKFPLRFLFCDKKQTLSSEPKTEELTPTDFSHIDIRIGEIVEAWNHPTADALYCQKIRILSDPDHYINVASGLRKYMKLDQMTGKVAVIVNLKARKLAGFESQGMVICATTPNKESCELLVPVGKVGQRIFLEDFKDLFPQNNIILPTLNAKKKQLEKCLVGLKTNEEGFVVWKDRKLMTNDGFLKSKLPNALVY